MRGESEYAGSPRFGELDGLRGLAALSVVIVHFNPAPIMPSAHSVSGVVQILNRLSLANLGVVFFFALSAFLLTYLGLREFDKTGSFDVKRFYLRRCLRIRPLYFVMLAVDFFIASPWSPLGPTSTASPSQWDWLKAHSWMFLGFLSNWSLAFHRVAGHADQSTPPLAILWSIAVEEQFYLLFPLLLSCAIRSLRALRVGVVALGLAAVLFRLGFLVLPVDVQSIGPAGGMYYATLTYADVFLAGCVAGWIAARGLPRGGPLLGVARQRGVGTLLIVAIACLSWVWQGQLWYPYALYSVVLYGVTGIVFSAVILWTTVNSESLVSRFLRSSPMRTFGVLSYAVYLSHPIGAALVRSDIGRLAPRATGAADPLALLTFWLYLGVTTVAATLGHLTIERRFLRLKERFVATTRVVRTTAMTFGAESIALVATVSAVTLFLARVIIWAYFGH